MNDFLPFLLPILPMLVEGASRAVTRRLPRGARPYVPVVLGAGLGAAGHALGLSPEMSALVFGASGPGAVAWHEWTKKGGKVTQVAPGSGRLVMPSDLPPKP